MPMTWLGPAEGVTANPEGRRSGKRGSKNQNFVALLSIALVTLAPPGLFNEDGMIGSAG